MKIVVTGPTGLVGVSLVKRLVAEGHTVRALCFDDGRALHGLDVERVHGDVRDPASLRRAFAGQEALVHLAAVILIDDGPTDVMRAVNVDGVRHAAEAALAEGLQRMVHLSSVHAYRTWRLGRPLTEDMPQCDGPPSPPYDCSKAAGEAALRAVIARGLDATILNPVGVLGPDDHLPSHLGGMLQKMHRGVIPLVPRGAFPWVDVRDVADAAVAALTRGRTGENYLLASEPFTLAEFDAGVRAHSGRRWRAREFDVRHLGPALWVAAGLRRLGVRSGFTKDAFRAVTAELEVDSSKARRELGFAPRPVAASLRDALDWFAANGKLGRRRA